MKLTKLIAVVLLLSAAALAQDFRATVSGRVNDAAGAAVPGAQVVVINLDTTTATTVETNESGEYVVPALQPGNYRLEIEKSGFKKFVQEGIKLAIGDKPSIDAALETGAITETVTVTADATPLETNDASRGEVITGERLVDLPLNGRNAFALAATVPGVNFTGRGQAATFLRTTSTASVSDVSISGGQPRFNEVLIDGVPATGSDGAVQFVPSVDATQEFKVQTNSFDAEFGRFAGGVINASIKAGTNDFNGTAFIFHRNSEFNARDPFAASIPQFNFNQYGVSIGGPVFLPAFGEGGPVFYNGKNRTFFFFNYEGSREGVPRTFTSTVPTLLQRQGDFSQTRVRNANGTISNVTIFDPATTRASGSGFVRDPFPGNIIPQNRINPISLNLLRLFPLPNAPGDPVTGANNFVTSFRDPIGDDGFIVRIDHRFNEKHQIFGRYSQRNFFLVRQGAFQNFITGDSEERFAPGASLDYTFIVNPTTVLNFRYGFTRFETVAQADSIGTDLTGLGFPSSFVGSLPVQAIPGIGISGFTSLTSQGGRLTNNKEDGHIARVGATKVLGKQTLRFGGEYRLFFSKRGARGAAAAGVFNFDTVFTRGPNPQATSTTAGNGLATFLLGLPGNSSEVGNTVVTNERAPYYGFYVQDDIRFSSKLTVNVGLRYEFEGENTERDNQFNRGFDFAATSPLEQQARINFAANPIPDIPAANFNVRGGLLFAGVNGQPRGITDLDRNNFSPRVGVAYSLNQKTVLRAGYGIFYGATTLLDEARLGFSVSTPFVGTINGAVPVGTLSNPFPNGLTTAPGSSQGLTTLAGQSISFINPDRKQPFTQQYQISIQRDLPGGILADVAYSGSTGRDLPVNSLINEVPEQFRAQARQTFIATGVNTLNTTARNPFFGLITGTSALATSQTTTRGQLLRPFPQFGSITRLNDSIGSSRYDSLQAKLSRRFAQGLTLLASYTFSKQLETVRFLNANDPEPVRELSAFDTPHRFVLSGTFQLPFGKGERFFSNANGFVGRLVEGFQVNFIYQAQSGVPLTIVGAESTGVSALLPSDERTLTRFFDTAAFRQRQTLELTATSTLPDVRSPGRNNLDFSLFKNTTIREGLRLQLRAEAFNVFNRPEYSSPGTTFGSSNFGVITQTNTFARQLQFGLKLLF